MDMLHLEVANKAYDVVVLVETHLDSSIADGEIFPAKYLVFRRDRMCNGRRGGGVLIAVSNTFKSSLRDDMLSDSELIFVDISFPNDRKITVGFLLQTTKCRHQTSFGYARRSSKFHISGFGYHWRF